MWEERTYQVIPSCYSQGERRMPTPEEVCTGSVGEQEGHHLTGILQNKSLKWATQMLRESFTPFVLFHQ